MLRREQYALEELMRYQESTETDQGTCEECARLLTEVLSIVLRTRALLSECTKAAEGGLIDNVHSLQDEELDMAFAERDAVRSLYVQHRQERHSRGKGAAGIN
jgi:TRAP-type uncharacterized transport system substrate-binding protein